MSVPADPKEILNAINRGLPNIATYLRTMLKREKLSEDAERLRAKYESLLYSLEQGNPPRPVSLIGDDDSGYFSANRPRTGEFAEQLKGFPTVHQSGFLLRRDEKFRWHRCWCKVDGKDMRFCIYEDANEENFVRSFLLENTCAHFGPPTAPEIDKDHCFSITGIAPEKHSDGESGTAAASEEIYFAAYTDADFQQWKDVLHLLISSRESLRVSFLLDNTTWGAQGGHDSTSTSSSNFSSNRDSMISTTSSLLYAHRNRPDSPTLRGKSLERERESGAAAEDMRALSMAKQQQPLPQPPTADAEADDDNASEGTIYESIDNLVLQFDATMRATEQAIGQVGQNMKGSRRRKKKELSRQGSFFSKHKGQKLKLLQEKKVELERGERFSGYLLKKSSSGGWKKKWCQLKGCILSYYKSSEESEGHECVVLDAKIHIAKDSKKPYAFQLCCKGMAEMTFAVENEDDFMEWLTILDKASKKETAGALEETWDSWQHEEHQQQQQQPWAADDNFHPHHALPEPPQFTNGLYSVPRSLPVSTMHGSLYDTPRSHPPSLPYYYGATPTGGMTPTAGMTPQAAIDSGLYSIPRSLQVDTPGPQLYTSGNPFDIYDVPRPISISPDEEGIYDNPFDVGDMEIYDYPPDATELGLLYPSYLETTDSGAFNTSTAVPVPNEQAFSERPISVFSDDSWKTLPQPPIPTSQRPSMAFSVTSSSDDYYQSSRNSVASMEGVYDYPRSTPVDSFLANIVERPSDITMEVDVPESALEYGQCTMRGHLHMHKKDQLKKWGKMFCVIRNNFLECHKIHSSSSSGPALKLFLPGSEVSGAPDMKRHWAFRVKHTRRAGVLHFAAENEDDYHRWIKAFQSAAQIEVMPVKTMEEIRISDLEMQRRWTSLEQDLSATATLSNGSASNPVEEYIRRGRANTWTKRKTYPEALPEDYQSDTLKRKRKFSWMKSNFMKKKGEKKGSNSDLSANRLSNISFDVQEDHLRMPPTLDILRKSVSLELLAPPEEEPATPLAPQIMSRSHRSTSPEGVERFQGYLRVQRRGGDSMWIRYWCILEELRIACYISQRDLTLTLSILLRGSRIGEASQECRRENSFMVWHMESGQCLYFAADDEQEFSKWLREVTRSAEQIIVEDPVTHIPVPCYFFPKDAPTSHSQGSSRSSVISAGASDDNVSIGSSNTGRSSSSQALIFHQGDLKKQSQGGKWKDRYCFIKDCILFVYASSTDRTPITAATLQGCCVELVNMPPDEVQRYVFRIVPTSGRSHTFAASSEQEMFTWVSAVKDCSHARPPTEEAQQESPVVRRRKTADANGPGSGNQSPVPTRADSKAKRKSKKVKETDLTSHVPASSLKHPVYSGFVEMQAGPAVWTRYWCVVHSDCLYVYEDQSSKVTVKTVVLPGYEVRMAGALVKKQFALVLTHPGVSPVCLAVDDYLDMNQLFHALELATRAESNKQQKGEGAPKVRPEEAPKVLSQKARKVSTGKKGPVKGDHNILKTKEDSNGSPAESSPATKDKATDYKAQRHAIVHKYEKRIRKTKKVANQTEQSLKRQQATLLHFKRELSRHILKLQELSANGNPHAQKKLREVRVKLQQVDKILPYLGKYVAVNRQAEIQTSAILKESCNMELQKLQGKGKVSPQKVSHSPKPERPASSTMQAHSQVPSQPPFQKERELSPLAKTVEAVPQHGKTTQQQQDESTQPTPPAPSQPPVPPPPSQPPVPPVPSQPPVPPAPSQPPVPPVRSQPPVPPVRSQPPVPPAPSQPPIPPAPSQPPVPPALSQPPVPPVRSQPPIPPVRSQPPVPPVRSQPPVPPAPSQPPIPPTPTQPPVPPAPTQPPIPPAPTESTDSGGQELEKKDHVEEESPYAVPSALRQQTLPTPPQSNYARLDFSQGPGTCVIRPPSVNYAQVDFDALRGVPVIVPEKQTTTPKRDTVSPAKEKSDAKRDVEKNPTPLNVATHSKADVTLPSVPDSSSHQSETPNGSVVSPRRTSVLAAIKQFEVAKTTEVKAKSPPPPVTRKPSVKHAAVGHQRSNSDSQSAVSHLPSKPSIPQAKPQQTETANGHSPQNGITDTARVERATGSAPPQGVITRSPLQSVSSPTHKRRPSEEEQLQNRIDVLKVTEGTPSVLDRIKALQQQRQSL